MRNVLGRGQPFNSAYNDIEISTDRGNPIELYQFVYKGAKETRTYLYTSALRKQAFRYNGVSYSYEPAFIQRSDSLRQDASGGSVETCTITMDMANPVSQLYIGAPPEDDSVRVTIWRYHNQNTTTLIKICDGVVSQVRWYNVYAELTITIENVLSRYIPRGTLSYWCQNNVYDSKCGINPAIYEQLCVVNVMKGTKIVTNSVLGKEEDYYTDGYIVMGNAKRAIAKHKDNILQLKYPVNDEDKRDIFFAYPGCNGIFQLCHTRFRNTPNFSGIPYIQPYNAFYHPVDKGAYWVDGNIVYRDQDRRLGEPDFDDEMPPDNPINGLPPDYSNNPPWEPEHAYNVGDVILMGTKAYECTETYISSNETLGFNYDLQQGKWKEIWDYAKQ